MPDSVLPVFSQSYEEARDKFLLLSKKHGAYSRSYKHPSACTPNGAPLMLETAWIGPRDAKNVMVMVSGTHGPEAYTGAAIQLNWLNGHKGFPSPSMAMLLIHGVNPYGWAHSSRTTEHNVDLNRNFVDSYPSDTSSQLTEQVQALLCSSSPKGPRFKTIFIGLIRLLLNVGITKVVNEISNGQYTHAKGIGYGGDSAEWANLTMRAVLDEHLKQADNVTIIDWHTGIGRYGEPYFLCFDEPFSEEYQRARSCWGAAIDKSNAGYSSGQRPDYQGLLINAARDIAQGFGAKTTTAVIEFGTYANLKMLKGLLIDRWLRYHADEENLQIAAKLQTQMLRLFYPEDERWRASVLQHSETIIAQSLAVLNTDDAS
jgi:hypothetical protein